jgi:hypothetical protein
MEEEKREHDLDATVGSAESANAELVAGIKNRTTVFLLIQTQSDSRWGLITQLTDAMHGKHICGIVSLSRFSIRQSCASSFLFLTFLHNCSKGWMSLIIELGVLVESTQHL